jgi:hypothetical protein
VARLYANENFPLPVVAELRYLGHDVTTTDDTGRSNQGVTDDLVLEWAIDDGRAVVTLNRRHFIRLHNKNSDHAGIIVCTVDPDFAGQAHRIHEAITSHQDLTGKLIRVNRPSSIKVRRAISPDSGEWKSRSVGAGPRQVPGRVQ